MTTVVYIDSVFILNAATDYLLLLITARLAGLVLRRGRYLVAAAVGGAYAAAAYLPGWAFLTAAPVKCAAGVTLCLIAFGQEERLGRLTALFFMVSCALAGCVLGLDLLTGAAGTEARTFLLAALGAWALMGVLFRTAARVHAAGTRLSARVDVGGRVTDLTALYDSGNALTDGGRPALVVSPETARRLFPARIAARLSPEALRNPSGLVEPLMRDAPSLRPRLTPYHSVGASAGLLLTVESDWTEVGGIRYQGLRLALSPTEFGTGYTALWGGEIGKEARDRDVQRDDGGVAATAGNARAGGALHRRKRYAAHAAEPRTGGGAVGARFGGGSASGTD